MTLAKPPSYEAGAHRNSRVSNVYKYKKKVIKRKKLFQNLTHCTVKRLFGQVDLISIRVGGDFKLKMIFILSFAYLSD